MPDFIAIRHLAKNSSAIFGLNQLPSSPHDTSNEYLKSAKNYYILATQKIIHS
jgi:hypothetical protein